MPSIDSAAARRRRSLWLVGLIGGCCAILALTLTRTTSSAAVTTNSPATVQLVRSSVVHGDRGGAASTTRSRPVMPKVPASCTVAGAPKAFGSQSGTFASQGLSFPAKYTSDGNAANIAAARADASRLLTKFSVPAGATVVSQEPNGDHGYLESVLAGWGASAENQWWVTPTAPNTLIKTLEVGPPTGSTLTGTESNWTATNKGKVISCAIGATFSWPAVTSVLGSRTVSVLATKLTDGQTGVLLSSMSSWVSLRATSERVPTNLGFIRVTATGPGKRHKVWRTFFGGARIRSVAALINAMPTQQPEQATIACPTDGPGPFRTITVGFYGAHDRRLALMRYSLDLGLRRKTAYWAYSYGSCGSVVDLQLGKRWRTPLIGGFFVYKLQKLVGMHLL